MLNLVRWINPLAMKTRFIISIAISALLLLSSCVEESKKYKELNFKIQSLEQSSKEREAEIEEIFAVLNEVESGLKSIREAESIIIIQSQGSGTDLMPGTKEQVRADMAAISETIKKYKSEIEKLTRDNKLASEQLNRRLKILTDELNEKSAIIKDLTEQLEKRETQLKVKSIQIATLDKTIANLKNEIIALDIESETQRMTIHIQAQELNSAYYIVGKKRELINANVMTRGGLFSQAKVSYLAEQSAFVKIDIREVSEINLNTQKAKILTLHPAGTYSLHKDNNGNQTLKISDISSFWKHTKYLVVQSQ